MKRPSPQALKEMNDSVRAYIEHLESVLDEIAVGRGAYDPDQLKHAGNCIDNMMEMAKKRKIIV